MKDIVAWWDSVGAIPADYIQSAKQEKCR